MSTSLSTELGSIQTIECLQQVTRTATATATKTSNSLFISKVDYFGRELRPKVCLNVLKKNNLCTKEEQEAALEVCRNKKGSLTSDVFERRTSTGSVLFALSSRDYEHIREKTQSNTTNLVASRHIARKKVHFRLTCVAQKRRCLNCLKMETVGKHLLAPIIILPHPLLPPFLSTQRNRQLKQQQRQATTKKSLEKWIRTTSNFIALITPRLTRQRRFISFHVFTKTF